MKAYFKNVLIGFDQFANTVFGGHPDETISARSGRAAGEGKLWGKALAWMLNHIQHDHTLGAEINDAQRAETVEGLEEQALKEKR